MPNENEIKLCSLYECILDKNTPNNIIFYGGRYGGKTKNVIKACAIAMAEHPYKDIYIGRASYGSIRDSIYNESVSAINEIPELGKQFKAQTSPLSIVRYNKSGRIYFKGIGGGRDRTKGFDSEHPLIIAVFEEIQELKDEEQLEQAISSVRRRMNKDFYKMVFIFNPPNWSLHWVNQWVEKKKRDKDYLVIKSSWQDVAPFLTDNEIKDILKLKINSPKFYDYLYMGNPSGAEGLIYPMFSKDLHTIDYATYLKNQHKLPIRMVVIGGDFAVNNDATVYTPIAILGNGQALVLPIFYHDPKQSGIYGSAFLIENFVSQWFNDLRKEFNLDTNNTPIIFSCDSASSDAIINTRVYMGSRSQGVFAFPKKSIPEMVSIVQSAFSKNMIYILDKGYYFDYVRKVKVKGNPLIEQLTKLAWNDKNNGYMPTIPNDATDSFTYGINMWFRNPFNLQYLNLLASWRKQFYTVNDLLADKR